MLFNFRTRVVVVIIAAFLSYSVGAAANPATKSGIRVINEYTEAVKTPKGKQKFRIRVEYNWDEAATYTYRIDSTGRIVDTSVVYGAPSPDESEIEAAIDIVRAHPIVQSIERRQTGIEIAGGFAFDTTSGACTRPARCLQIFLFDAENVVRHMLVDMRTSVVVDTDYIPPQNVRAEK